MNKVLIIFAITLAIVASRDHHKPDFFKSLSEEQKQLIEDKFNELKESGVERKEIFEQMKQFAASLNITLPAPPQHRDHNKPDIFKSLSEEQKQLIEDKFNELKESGVEREEIFEQIKQFASSLNITLPEPPQHKDHRRQNSSDSDNENQEEREHQRPCRRNKNFQSEENGEQNNEQKDNSFLKSKLKKGIFESSENQNDLEDDVNVEQEERQPRGRRGGQGKENFEEDGDNQEENEDNNSKRRHQNKRGRREFNESEDSENDAPQRGKGKREFGRGHKQQKGERGQHNKQNNNFEGESDHQEQENNQQSQRGNKNMRRRQPDNEEN